MGLFDLSHMGEVALRGAGALDFAGRALVSDPTRLELGQAQYSLLCAPDGGVIDDLILYRLEDRYLIVCNAANRDAVVEHLRQLASGWGELAIEDESDATALVAPQGPPPPRPAGDPDRCRSRGAAELPPLPAEVAGVRCVVARTGYTGEDGFELFCAASDAERVWGAVMDAGQPHGILPCGLASRDTLRLEAGMPLYGNELGRDVNPYEANLGRVVKLEKGEFVGREALAAINAAGPGGGLSASSCATRASPAMATRSPTLREDAEPVGEVTSGSFSPTLGDRIAMAFVRADVAADERLLAVMIRDRRCRAEQVQLPFYRRPRPAEEPTT